jgi:hypothetical protein
MFWPLLLGTGVLLASLLTYGMATALLVQLIVLLLHRDYPAPGFTKDVVSLVLVTLITAAAHLIQIALWAVLFLLCGLSSGFEEAFYLSAENYTALGYGDIVLPGRWRLLGPVEAINGLLLFGLSTALMFAVLSRLVTSRLHSQRSKQDESAGPGSRGGEPGSS